MLIVDVRLGDQGCLVLAFDCQAGLWGGSDLLEKVWVDTVLLFAVGLLNEWSLHHSLVLTHRASLHLLSSVECAIRLQCVHSGSIVLVLVLVVRLESSEIFRLTFRLLIK